MQNDLKKAKLIFAFLNHNYASKKTRYSFNLSFVFASFDLLPKQTNQPCTGIQCERQKCTLVVDNKGKIKKKVHIF